MMKRAITAVVAIVLASSLAVAGPPTTRRVPGSAKWVIHFDVEKITNSAIAGGILEIVTGKDSPVPKEQAEKALEIWEILGNLKSVTLYGSTGKETEAVAVADHRYDEAGIMKVLGISVVSPTQTHTHGDHTIYTFTPKHKKKRGKQFVCFHSDGIAVAGETLARIKEALDLLDGKGKSLTRRNPLAKMLTASEGSFMVAAAVDLDKIMKAPAKKTARRRKRHGALLKKSHSARFELGEVGKNMFATFSATMVTEEDAENLQMAAQGIRAMLLLGHNQDQQNAKIVKVARAIKISRKGKNVAVGIKYPVEDILAAMQTAVKKRHTTTARAPKETAP